MSDLAHHFQVANIAQKLEQAAGALDQFIGSKVQGDLDQFRKRFETAQRASDVVDDDLNQPLAREVIEELGVNDLLNPDLASELQRIIQEGAYDHAAISSNLKSLAGRVGKRINQIAAISKGFGELDVELERVVDEQAEVGVLLPREVVGETVSAFTSELDKLGSLFRAINELTGASDYDPRIRTVSTSWWSIFIELGPAQVLVWVAIIERIVSLFKSNLEIKDLQQRLDKYKLGDDVSKRIEEEVSRRVTSELAELAKSLRLEHAKIPDEGRLNEIEVQLRYGLRHLAIRINQGAKVEINIAVPELPKEEPPPVEGQPVDQLKSEAQQKLRAHVIELQQLRMRGLAASSDSLKIKTDSPLLVNHEEDGGSGGQEQN